MRHISLPAAASFAAAALAACALAFLCAACAPDPIEGVLPPADLKPPLVLEAGPRGSRAFVLEFDEEVRAVEGSYGLEPGPRAASAVAEGCSLSVELGEELEPGADYAVAGSVEDAAGNVTRFVFRFAGWNENPARLRLSELQAAKNSSAARPHRDYLELEASAAGNLGGVELSWASTAKLCNYRFPGVEVRKGERIVLHLAPQGLAEEKDEKGGDLAASGGVDATASGRDFWCSAGGLPDASGAVVLRLRPGEEAQEALFYADQAKTGPLGQDRLSALVSAAGAAWPIAGAAPAWEDAFRWKPSAARPLCRGAGAGPAAWYVGAAGSQSPGSANAPPAAR